MGRFVQVIARTWLSQELYGHKYAPSIATYTSPYLYVKAMLYTASADVLDKVERRYIQGMIEVLLSDPDPEIIHFVEHFQIRDPELVGSSSFLSNSMVTSRSMARVLVYDALRTATADGVYDPAEKVHVYRVSRQTGISDSVTAKLEDISVRELRLSQRKRELLLHGRY